MMGGLCVCVDAAHTRAGLHIHIRMLFGHIISLPTHLHPK